MKCLIIAFCGLPLSGKSTLAKTLANYLDLPLIDIDEIRHELFQNPQEEMDPEQVKFQMAISYKVLFLLTEWLVKLSHAVVITATFSREWYHKEIIGVSERNKVPIKAIYCYAPDEAIRERLEQREKRKDSFSGCRTWEHYEGDKARYQFLPLDLLKIDTSKPSVENISAILDFLES